MNLAIYIGIFAFKIIEDALSTLRIILVANGKKKLGALLQFIIALIWVVLTGTVITNIGKDPLKIIFFALGSLVGSYLGSCLEEKLALGTNQFAVKINKNMYPKIASKLKKEQIQFTSTQTIKDKKIILLISTPRKNTKNIIKLIRTYEKKAPILSEKVKIIYPKALK